MKARGNRGPLQLCRRDRKSTRLNSSHTVIYTLSLHDALPISTSGKTDKNSQIYPVPSPQVKDESEGKPRSFTALPQRSEEHTSELQSHSDLHSFPTRRSSDLNLWKDRQKQPNLSRPFPSSKG